MNTHNRFYGELDYEQIESTKQFPDEHRSPFQVDRDRVIFSLPFRRLQSKTQVFQSGEYDFYRTRLTHTIEVARIARSICEYLNARSERLRNDFFIDPDLVEAVGLAHDIGHPPFGHLGERKLNELMHTHGGFEGNAQTLRILTELIYTRDKAPRGMNCTRAFIDGVLKYKNLYSECIRTTGTHKEYPDNHFLYDEQSAYRDFALNHFKNSDGLDLNKFKSIECQIMDWADDTAYSLHDIVDGVQARFITPEILEEWQERQRDLSSLQIQLLTELKDSIREGYYEPRIGRRIGKYIHACRIEKSDTPLSDATNRHRFRLVIDGPVAEECALFKRIAVDNIFKSTPIQQIEFKGGHLLDQLFSAYQEHYINPSNRSLRILPERTHNWIKTAKSQAERYRHICDHLSSLTDAEAIRTHKRLYSADFGSIIDFV